LIRKVFRFDFAPDISVLPLDFRNGGDRFVLRLIARFAATLVMTVMTLTLFLAPCPEAAFAASPESPQQGVRSSEGGAPKSEAAEAWDAVKNTTNPALLEAFIKRYRTTFFAEMAKARLAELKAAATKPAPVTKPSPTDSAKAIPTFPIHQNPGQAASTTHHFEQPALPILADGVRERAVLYEEIPSDPNGRQYEGSVIWHAESIKMDGKPDEIAARADVEIPSRGLRMTMSFKRNFDSSLPASHVISLTLAVPADSDSGGVANVPGILMKSSLGARGTPLAGLAVKVTSGFFLVGLSSVATDRERNLKTLMDLPWFDIPIVYANQRRAILAIGKGESGDQVFKTVLSVWGPHPGATQPTAAAP
jgi:hypothetical protein